MPKEEDMFPFDSEELWFKETSSEAPVLIAKREARGRFLSIHEDIQEAPRPNMVDLVFLHEGQFVADEGEQGARCVLAGLERGIEGLPRDAFVDEVVAFVVDEVGFGVGLACDLIDAVLAEHEVGGIGRKAEIHERSDIAREGRGDGCEE